MKVRHLFLSLVILFASQFSHSEILFEGYYKVNQFKKHIGFLVLRHEIDDKTKNFKTTSLIKLAKGGFNMTESYKVESDASLLPLSLSYLAVADKTTKTIEAKVKNLKMTGTVTENGKKIKLNADIPKGAFFSSALYYLMLQSKDGLKTGSTFDYTAVTEEGPVPMTGKVTVDKKMVTQGTFQLMKINNQFAGSDYDNLVNAKGEVISAATPATSIESELVKTPAEAIEGIKIAKGTLEKIFGNLPEGKINSKNK